MPLRFEVLTPIQGQRLTFRELVRKRIEVTREFESKIGRPPTEIELRMLYEADFNPPLYRGTCPSCKAESTMHDHGNGSTKKVLTLLLRAIGLTILKPIDVIKRTISAQKAPQTCICKSCNAALLVCPICVASFAWDHLNISQELYCPNCNAFLG